MFPFPDNDDRASEFDDPAPVENSVSRVVITQPALGICHMQVCAVSSATDEEILAVCNRENPAGTTNGWMTVCRSGEPSPVTCADDPGRQHFIVSC